MFKRFFIAVVVSALAATTILAEETPKGPFRQATFDEALTAAKAEGKIVMVDFYTTWCGPCKMLDKTTWEDKSVQSFLTEKTVPLKIDAEKEGVELAKKYRVHAYPTLLFVKADGTEIERIIGYRAAKPFLDEASDYLNGKSAVSRVKEKLAKDGEDPGLRMELAEAFGNKGQFKESLDELLWCFDNGGKKPEFEATRTSYLPFLIAVLGRDYPPALDALRERRDKAEQGLSGGRAAEFVALNRALNDGARTLTAFDKLGAAGDKSETRTALAKAAIDQLLAAKRYSDIVESIPNIPETIKTSIEKNKEALKKAQADPNMPKEAAAFMKKGTVGNGGKYFEALVGAGKSDEAAKVADLLIDFDSSGQTFATLIKHAKRVENADTVKALADRGLKSVPEAEKADIQKAVDAPTPSK